jgi:hypothetical protein
VAAGALATERLFVVDREASRADALPPDPRVCFERAEWSEWLDRRLSALPGGAHLVPYHWAPHLFFEWLARQARRGGGEVRRGGLAPSPAGVPYARATGDGDRALSYATWICPPTCIEPALCPHTRGAKDWSLCRDLEAAPPGFDAAFVFRCLHLVHGVGTLPVASLLEARDRVLAGLGTGPRRYLVATSSHCHALAATLTVESLRSSAAGSHFA